MIKVHYLGTGAAEGFPSPFCNCSACRKVRQTGGKNIKTRSCAVVNGHVLIDLSPDIFTQSRQQGISLAGIDNLVCTHSHSDHLDLFSLMLRCRDGATVLPDVPDDKNYISVWGNAVVEARISQAFGNEPHANRRRLHFTQITPGVPFRTGELEFLPLAANHITGEKCCIFCISDGQNAFLYGNDTGLLPESTFEALARYGKKIAAVSLDCSRGTLPGDAHMGIAECRQTRSRLLDIGVIDKNTVVYLNHFSHVCGMIPEEFACLAYKDSMNLTYDGLTVTIPA